MKKIIPIILCGGSGTRLWPKSRETMPKQFLKLLGHDTLLQATAKRALNILGCPPENVVTVTIADMKPQTEQQLGTLHRGLTEHILTEPLARNTAAAVAYATHYVWETFGEDAYAWVLLSDHYIGNEEALKKAVEDAYGIAQQDYIVTFGIEPTRPDTGFGYIKKSTAFESSTVSHVEEFVEKPPLETAQNYLDSGEYLWSSGMHLFKVKKVLKGYHAYAKESIRLVEKSMQKGYSKQIPSKDLYARIKSEPFETAVLEKAQQVAVVPCDIQWSDLGTFNSLWEEREKDSDGNVMDGHVVCHKAKDCFIQTEDRLVACVGVQDLVIMETSDAILVANKNKSDDIKTMVKSLQKTHPNALKASYKSTYEWGSTKIISKDYNCITSELVIRPGHRRPLHTTTNASKTYTIVSGKALFKIEDTTHLIEEQNIFHIDHTTSHLILNAGKQDLYMIEIQYRVEEAISDAEPLESDPQIISA